MKHKRRNKKPRKSNNYATVWQLCSALLDENPNITFVYMRMKVMEEFPDSKFDKRSYYVYRSRWKSGERPKRVLLSQAI